MVNTIFNEHENLTGIVPEIPLRVIRLDGLNILSAFFYE